MLRSSSNGIKQREKPSQLTAMPEISATHSGLSLSRPSLELTQGRSWDRVRPGGQAQGSSHSWFMPKRMISTHIITLFIQFSCAHCMFFTIFWLTCSKRNTLGVCFWFACVMFVFHWFDIILTQWRWGHSACDVSSSCAFPTVASSSMKPWCKNVKHGNRLLEAFSIIWMKKV